MKTGTKVRNHLGVEGVIVRARIRTPLGPRTDEQREKDGKALVHWENGVEDRWYEADLMPTEGRRAVRPRPGLVALEGNMNFEASWDWVFEGTETLVRYPKHMGGRRPTSLVPLGILAYGRIKVTGHEDKIVYRASSDDYARLRAVGWLAVGGGPSYVYVTRGDKR